MTPYKRNKWHNEPVTVDGIRYDSKNEYRRYCFLKLMEQAGEISNLRYHVIYELIPAITRDEVVHMKTKDKVVTKVVQRAVKYEADFVYINTATSEEVVEDFKGVLLDVFRLKASIFFWRYGKQIKIVKQVNEPIN